LTITNPYSYDRGISEELQSLRITNQLAHIDRMLNEANQSKPTWYVDVANTLFSLIDEVISIMLSKEFLDQIYPNSGYW
jgi:hypothetical protein